MEYGKSLKVTYLDWPSSSASRSHQFCQSAVWVSGLSQRQRVVHAEDKGVGHHDEGDEVEQQRQAVLPPAVT